MKVWAKIQLNDKILRDVVYEDNREVNPSSFIKSLQEIAYLLDIAAPVSLPSHYKHFLKFNRVKYLPRDFIEDTDFTLFVLERVLEKK